MAHELSWVVSRRILLIDLENEVPMDEMVRLIDETHTYVNAGQSPVHILIDATKLQNRPVNFQEITTISKSMPNMATGWWVLINPGKMIWFTASILSKLLHVKLKSVHNREEALTVLQHVDLTLDSQQTLPVST